MFTFLWCFRRHCCLEYWPLCQSSGSGHVSVHWPLSRVSLLTVVTCHSPGGCHASVVIVLYVTCVVSNFYTRLSFNVHVIASFVIMCLQTKPESHLGVCHIAHVQVGSWPGSKLFHYTQEDTL